MPKSRLLQFGGGLVSICSAVAYAVFPDILPAEAKSLVFFGAIVGVVIGGLIIWYGWKMGKIEDKQLIDSIPQILSDIHTERGKITNKYIKELTTTGNWKAIELIALELNSYLGGIELPKKINTDNLLNTIFNVLESLPKMTEKAKSIESIELARLVAKSTETHLHIQERLNNQKVFRRLEKQLNKAKVKMGKGIAIEATKVINPYLTFSEGYWALDMVMAYIAEMKKDQSLVQTAYHIYRDKFREEMDTNLAKVSEVIN